MSGPRWGFQTMTRMKTAALLVASTMLAGSAHASIVFNTSDLVVSVEGNGVQGAASGSYTDNQAAPLSLFEFSHNGTSSGAYVASERLPQASSGSNSAVSGEYGSQSEGAIQLSGDGKSLTIMGYGVNAQNFNKDPTAYGTLTTDPTKSTALGQSGSLQGQGYIAVPRVVAEIDGNGKVDSSTALYGIFNGNNPRSVYSANGSTFYVSGQGDSPDATGGVFYAAKGASSGVAITGLDTNTMTSSQDTRFVTVVNGQLYVSVDSKEGKGSNRDFVATLGSAGSLPTSLANGGNGPAQISGFGNNGGTGKLTITTTNTNGINAVGSEVNLSPENFFFANSTTLYVADSGMPKNDSVTNDTGSPTPSTLGDGGLQKWSLSSKGKWSLDYTLSAGLGLVDNTAASGTTGLLGLTGKVDGSNVELFATNYTVGDTDPTFLYGITDLLSATMGPSGEHFTQLAAAPTDSNFKGVSFAPSGATVPEPQTYALMIIGVGLAGAAMRRRRVLAA